MNRTPMSQSRKVLQAVVFVIISLAFVLIGKTLALHNGVAGITTTRAILLGISFLCGLVGLLIYLVRRSGRSLPPSVGTYTQESNNRLLILSLILLFIIPIITLLLI